VIKVLPCPIANIRGRHLGSGTAGGTRPIYAARHMMEPADARGIQPGGQAHHTTEVGISGIPARPFRVPADWEQMAPQAEHPEPAVAYDLIRAPIRAPGGPLPLGRIRQALTADRCNRTGAQASGVGIASEERLKAWRFQPAPTCDGFLLKGKKVDGSAGGNTAVRGGALYSPNSPPM